MKTNISILITLFTLSCLNAQNTSNNSSEDYYIELAKRNQVTKIPASHDELIDSTYEYYLEDMKQLFAKNPEDTVIYNNTVLNKYFEEIITNYADNTGDLSFNKYFINANTSERNLTIGRSLRLENFFAWSKEKREGVKRIRPIQKVSHLFTGYLSSNLSSGFSTLISQDSETGEFNFNSNIGLGLKYTYIGNGTIGSKSNSKIEEIRNKFVKKNIEKSIKKYDKASFDDELEIENIDAKDENEKTDNKMKLIREKHIEFYEEIIDKELEYAKAEKLINSSKVWWLSLEGFIPITRREVNFSQDSIVIQDVRFGNWNVSGNANLLYSFSKFNGASFKVSAEGSVFNTNNFIANNTTAASLQNIIQDNGTNQIEGSSSSLFLGNYNQFVATSARFEAVSLFFGNTIGLSAAIDFRFGEIENTNWKVGIPFSLNDKDDKQTVNFELQWREINSVRSVGISVGYNFGGFVQ